MKKIFYNFLFIFLLLIPLAFAETTFFDNPDNFFIMSSSATGEITGGATGETAGSGGCIYKWNCTKWGECLPSGKQNRNCINIGTCSDVYKTPEINKNCNYPVKGAEEEKKEPESEKQDETEIISEKKIADRDTIFLCSIIILTIGLIIFYFKKDYFKKQIRKYLK